VRNGEKFAVRCTGASLATLVIGEAIAEVAFLRLKREEDGGSRMRGSSTLPCGLPRPILRRTRRAAIARASIL